MNKNELLKKIKSLDSEIDFHQVIVLIDQLYDFKETGFQNGVQNNQQGENSGSCKIFSFAQELNLDQKQTLLCFGQFYQQVLNEVNTNSHQNIRQFMINGWDGIKFNRKALKIKVISKQTQQA